MEEELEEKAKDEKGWKLAVRSIKDGTYINNLGKGSKRKNNKTKRQKKKKKGDSAEGEEGPKEVKAAANDQRKLY